MSAERNVSDRSKSLVETLLRLDNSHILRSIKDSQNELESRGFHYRDLTHIVSDVSGPVDRVYCLINKQGEVALVSSYITNQSRRYVPHKEIVIGITSVNSDYWKEIINNHPNSSLITIDESGNRYNPETINPNSIREAA